MLKTLVFFLLICFLYHNDTTGHGDHAHVDEHVEQKEKRREIIK